MEYICKCNLSVGRGYDFMAGDLYTGPEDQVQELLQKGLISMDESKAKDSFIAKPVIKESSDSLDDLFDEKKPKKSYKKRK